MERGCGKPGRPVISMREFDPPARRSERRYLYGSRGDCPLQRLQVHRLLRRLSRGVLLPGRDDALYQPQRLHRLRSLRSGMPRRGDLRRGERAGTVEELHPDQRGQERGPGRLRPHHRKAGPARRPELQEEVRPRPADGNAGWKSPKLTV